MFLSGIVCLFSYALERMNCVPNECIFVDNSVRNLDAAQDIGMNTVLFNRDKEEYAGNIVHHFGELGRLFVGRLLDNF